MLLDHQETSRKVTPHIFRHITSYSQIDEKLVEGVVKCVSTSGLVTTDEDSRQHTKGDIVTIYTDQKTGEVCAFNSITFSTPGEQKAVSKDHCLYNVKGVYLAGAAVHGSYQHEGLYQRMNKARIGVAVNRHLPLVFTSTQNPNVQAGLESTLEKLKVARTILTYSSERILEPGRYPYCLYTEIPANPKYPYAELDYHRADGKSDAYVLIYLLELMGRRR